MKRSHLVILIVLLLGIAGGAVFLYLTRPLAAPSETVSTPKTTNNTATGTTLTFSIDPTASKATFEIFEVLSGQDKIVLGTTSQVTGSITVDKANPQNSTITPVRVNARTFITDSERRNAAIGRLILKSEETANEFIVFTPKKMTSLPTMGVPGTAYTFKVTGDLTIAGVTKTATFDTTATFNADNTVTGKATGSVKRGDYNLIVPSLPFLADVGEEVKLSFEFVAR